jgi:hypothetical protein
LRLEDNETIEPADPLPRATVKKEFPPSASNREQIAFRLLGELKYDPGKGGYFVRCPGEQFHDNKTGPKHTILYLHNVPTLSCQHLSCSSVVESFNKVLRSEIGKAERILSHVSSSYRDVRRETNFENGAKPIESKPLKDFLTFYSVSDVKNYVPPEGLLLIGDYHVVRGATTVIAGPPGVGKSRASVYLAVCGATQQDFFGLKIHAKFKTMILQCENGLYRLKSEFGELDKEHDDYIRISDPPPYGFLFKRSDFRSFLKDKIAEFMPGVLVIDPWNRVEHGQDSKDYLDSYDLILSILPEGDLSPAIVINAHHRKSGKDGIGTGRDLLRELSGGLALGSVPRTVFGMLHASNDTEENRVVWICCKNNDGELGKRSAWERKNGSFSPVTNFDWTEFDSATKEDKRVTITEEMVKEVLEDGPILVVLARDKLEEISGGSRASCYRALSENGRFADHLLHKNKMVKWLE